VSAPLSEVVVVAGLGRCGSSLTMQMLAAGGMPCIGEPPAFEDVRFTPGARVAEDWFASLIGNAVKVLDPHHVQLPKPAPARVIWLNRDYREQAASQAKFLQAVAGIGGVEDVATAFRRSMPQERREALRALAGWPLLEQAFEALILEPAASARAINAFVGGHLDADAMARVVRRRPTECAPGLDMECELIAEYQGRRR
jgi:hypothetical protein